MCNDTNYMNELNFILTLASTVIAGISLWYAVKIARNTGQLVRRNSFAGRGIFRTHNSAISIVQDDSYVDIIPKKVDSLNQIVFSVKIFSRGFFISIPKMRSLISVRLIALKTITKEDVDNMNPTDLYKSYLSQSGKGLADTWFASGDLYAYDSLRTDYGFGYFLGTRLIESNDSYKIYFNNLVYKEEDLSFDKFFEDNEYFYLIVGIEFIDGNEQLSGHAEIIKILKN